MWSWASRSAWQGRDKDEEDTEKQPNMAEGPRQTRGVGYYQRSKIEELSPRASDPVGMDRGKAQHPGMARREGSTPHIPLQLEDEEVGEGYEKVDHEDLEELKAKQSGKASSRLIPATQEPKRESPQEKEGLDESYTALDQALTDIQELQRKQAEALKRVAELEKRNLELKATVARKEGEVMHLRSELTASSGPASTLSADSERYFTPHTSLAESVNEHRGLAQTDSDTLLRLQYDNATKDDTIKSLEREVNQFKQRLKYAHQLEDQNVRLITEESKHEEENHILRREVESLKRRASVSRPLTRSYAHEQKLQELAQRYEQQYHEELEENSRLRGKISELEKEIQEQEEGTTQMDDPELNVELKHKEQLYVHTLLAQVEALQQHSKGQSRQILLLKQEMEALKLAGEEIDTSWREMVDQLEEENKKLSHDVGALHRDRKFMEKSLEATKAKLEQVEPLPQKLKAQLERMTQKEEWARKQLESITESSRKSYQTCHELQEEKKQLIEQFQRLSGLNDDNVTLVNELKAQVRKLDEEKKTLLNEVRIAKTELSQKVAEKEALLQAAQAEQLQMSQLTQEKDRFLQSLRSDKDQLSQQLSMLNEQIQRYSQQPQSQRPHESNFWEVPRDEITLVQHKILGIGAWGYVVEGVFRGQQVAVKCLHDMIRQPEVIATIRKEIGIMAQIRHPNMVMLIAAVIDAKSDPLIVTELLEISLRKAYENHRLQGSSLLSIFRDVASALNYLHLHQRGEIIHRDVSSANVLLEAKPNNQWKAKLSDFGSAKLAIEAKTTGPGAPAYTAPEVRKEMGIRQTAKLDVYSYGILLCEVTVEQFPSDGSLPSMMQALRSRWPYMHGLVTSCIQEHPHNRPTMSYVLGEFDKFRPQN